MTRGRTIVLGVDSLDLLLVKRWAAQGLLPFFASLLRKGSLVRLSTVSRVLQGAVWPSLLTGRSPGQHGTFFLNQLTSGTYHLDDIGPSHFPHDPYFGRLDAHGVRCAIVNVPGDLPLGGFRGLQVVDWLTEFRFWRGQPGARRDHVGAEFGRFDAGGGYGPTRDSPRGHRRLRQKLEKGIGMKAALVARLLQREDLDHVFAVFGEAHKAGHFFWKYMDCSHPDHVVAEPYLRDALLSVYQALDTRLAALSALISERDNLIIFSDHGMQANYRGDHFVAAILEKLGLSSPQTALRDEPAGSPGVSRLWRGARSIGRAFIDSAAPGGVARRLRRQFGRAARVDWSQVRMFQLPTDRNSYLRVNLQGREPAGVVPAGRAYEELLTRVEHEFRALVNAETGRPAVEEVFRVHELYPGPRANQLPDMVILWSSDAPLRVLESPRLGRMQKRIVEDRSGNHRPEGFLLARGPGINPMARHLSGDVLQLPATLLALHGVPAPPSYEMPPLSDLLAARFDEPQPLRELLTAAS